MPIEFYVFAGLVVAVLVLLVFASRYVEAAVSLVNFAKFLVSVAEKYLPFIKLYFSNRPKTDKEWADWRRLMNTRRSDWTAKDVARFKELQKLNREYKDNG
jgi:hypothetical protein